MTLPHDSESCWNDSRGNYDTHHYVEITHGDASIEHCKSSQPDPRVD